MTKTLTKKAEAAIAAGDAEAAREPVRIALSNMDLAAKKGVIHANAAARRKSRLALKQNAALQAQPSEAEKPKSKRTKASRTSKTRKPKKAEKKS